MANKVPLAYADIELQLSTAVSIGDTSFTLSSATDDDGEALPAGKYCFTVDNGSSNKEYLLGQLNGTSVTSVVSVSRQGVETSGAVRAHRVGASAIISDFATIQRLADILRGQETLDADNPIYYDAEPALTDREQIATVAYVLDNVSGGTVLFDNQVIGSVNAGESVSVGDLIYLKESDQEWYKCDADTAATVQDVQLGIARGSGSDGVAITGGVHTSGAYTTTGLTAGERYYASNTAGGIVATTPGTTSVMVGVALSTTRLLFTPHFDTILTKNEKDALAGGGEYGTPSSANKVVTTDFLTANPSTKIVEFTSDGTWTKDTGLVGIFVRAWGGGGSGGGLQSQDADLGGGGGGGYQEAWFSASDLSATETVTVGTGGAGVTSGSGNNGEDTTFGSLLTALRGLAGASNGGSAAAGGDGGDIQAGSTTFRGAGGSINGGVGLFWGGGGGGGANGTTGVGDGGNALFGGGGGGCAISESGGTEDNGTGGTSVYGGNGGAGSIVGNGVTGSVPGGGGGGSYSGTSGAGGDGLVIVYEFYA